MQLSQRLNIKSQEALKINIANSINQGKDLDGWNFMKLNISQQDVNLIKLIQNKLIII